MHFKTCLMQGGVKGFLSVRSKDRVFWQIFPRTHSSCLPEPWGYAQETREGLFARTRKQYTIYSSLPPSECLWRCFDTKVQSFGVSCWLTWASEWKQPLGRPFAHFFAGVRRLSRKGVHSRRARSCRQTYPGQPAGTATKAKNVNPPNLAKPKPNQDQFLLQPNFSHLIFDAFVTIPHQDCTKTITSLIHQFCYQGKKSYSCRLTWVLYRPVPGRRLKSKSEIRWDPVRGPRKEDEASPRRRGVAKRRRRQDEASPV